MQSILSFYFKNFAFKKLITSQIYDNQIICVFQQTLDSPEPDEQVKARSEFIEAHSTKDTNKIVAFYMISALEYFKDKPQDTVKSIAMEFATLGIAGIDPKKENYEVLSVSKKWLATKLWLIIM